RAKEREAGRLAQAVDVGVRPDLVAGALAQLIRRSIVQRAGDARTDQCVRVRGGSAQSVLHHLLAQRETKVDQLHVESSRLATHQQVGWLDVSMTDPLLVRLV